MTGERFQWHPGSVVYGRQYELSVNNAGFGLSSLIVADKGDPGECRIAANSSRPETLLSIFGAVAAGLEFAVMPPMAKRNRDSDDLVPDAEPIAACPTSGHVFQVCSGGSMGPARRIRRSHGSWLASFEINRHLLSLRAHDSYAVLGELYHSLALYAALEALHIGADLHLLVPYRAASQLEKIIANEVSVIYATPAQLRLLVSAAIRTGLSVPAVRLVLVGGAPLDKRTALDVGKLFADAVLRRFYGTSETSYIAIDDGSAPYGSAGFLYPGVEVEVWDGCGAEPSGDSGVFWARSPYVCLGRGWPVFSKLSDESGFVSTGDIGRWCADGRLEVLGRNDRLFKVADVIVHPEQIESFICSLPGVRSAVAYPIGDDMKGNVVGARVSLDKAGPTVDEILMRCRTRLGGLMAPRRIEVGERSPELTATGKPCLAADAIGRRPEEP